jgi:CrcB protein
MAIVLIAVGGALGSICRYLLGAFVQRTLHIFPAGTFVVNVLGCLAIGWLYQAFPPGEGHTNISALAIVGFCGGFTTFSTFSLETIGLINGGEVAKALTYVALSAVTCVAATALGMRLGR